jgi:hypothetical protein
MKQRDYSTSQLFLALLLLAIAYAAWWRGILSFILNIVTHESIEGQIEQTDWDNEACAWNHLLSVFDLAACTVALRGWRLHRKWSLVVLFLGIGDLLLTWWGFNPADPCPPQSNVDDKQFHLADYWVRGNGWLAGLVIVPCLIACVVALVRDRQRTAE